MVTYKVSVKTNACENQVIEDVNRCLKVMVTATPEKGKANKALIDLLAEYFKLPKSRVLLISGVTSKHKLIGISYD